MMIPNRPWGGVAIKQCLHSKLMIYRRHVPKEWMIYHKYEKVQFRLIWDTHHFGTPRYARSVEWYKWAKMSSRLGPLSSAHFLRSFKFFVIKKAQWAVWKKPHGFRWCHVLWVLLKWRRRCRRERASRFVPDFLLRFSKLFRLLLAWKWFHAW